MILKLALLLAGVALLATLLMRYWKKEEITHLNSTEPVTEEPVTEEPVTEEPVKVVVEIKLPKEEPVKKKRKPAPKKPKK